jgi:hypothetical protein
MMLCGAYFRGISEKVRGRLAAEVFPRQVENRLDREGPCLPVYRPSTRSTCASPFRFAGRGPSTGSPMKNRKREICTSGSVINRHQPIPDQHAHLTAMMRGHYAYYGITGNSRRLSWPLAQHIPYRGTYLGPSCRRWTEIFSRLPQRRRTLASQRQLLLRQLKEAFSSPWSRARSGEPAAAVIIRVVGSLGHEAPTRSTP